MAPKKTGGKKCDPPTLTEVTADGWQFPLREELLPVTPGLEPRTKAPSSEDESQIVLSVEGKFKTVSEGFCGMLGYQASELLSRPIDPPFARG